MVPAAKVRPPRHVPAARLLLVVWPDPLRMIVSPPTGDTPSVQLPLVAQFASPPAARKVLFGLAVIW